MPVRMGSGWRSPPAGDVRSAVKKRPFLLVAAALPTLALVAIFSWSAGARASSFHSLDVFARVLAHVENAYVEPIDDQRLIYGAIQGMLSTLDPHTQFLPPEEYREMRADTVGEFGGLGVELEGEAGQVLVHAPIEGTPASLGGILRGDRILAIDGVPTEGMNLNEAARKMRGPPGSKVALTILREGFAAPRDFVLLRDRIVVPAVEWRLLPGGRGYVRIKSFQERTDAFLTKALDDLRRQNQGKELAGLILDLRNNPGGLLEQAVRVVDRFVSEGVIVSTRGRNGKLLGIERAHAAGTEASYPMVVLVNRGSASASEVVAGALQDHGRAIVMGTPTFGKGSVQTVIDLEDGSGLKMTVAHYLTPGGRMIHGSGVLPDVPLSDGAPRLAQGPEGDGEDPQLQAALRTLEGARGLRAAGQRASAQAEAAN